MGDTNQIHSRAYHRYFEGYEEREQCTENGGVVIRRIYTGMYYKQERTDKQCICARVGFVILYVLSVALFLYASTRPVPCNIIWYVTIPSVASLVFAVLTAVYLFLNVTSPRVMEIRSYRDSHERLTFVSLVDAVCMGLTAVCAALSLFQDSQEIGMTLLCAAFYLFSGVLIFLIYFIEKKTKYLMLESKYTHKTMGSRIRYMSEF